MTTIARSPAHLPRGDERFQFETSCGTNEGGWYRDLATGNRKYVKLYNNPDQGRVEVLANRHYEILGIPAAHSDLYVIRERVAVVSDEVVGDNPITFRDIAKSRDAMGGFVTDAYLANYDVFGLAGDNVVRETKTGCIVRIDNGGSLHFRARGKLKSFPHDDIPELATMRDPTTIPMSNPSVAQSTAGRVFHTLTESDLTEQAQEFSHRLHPADICELIEQVGFPEQGTHDFVVKSLLGRYAYLMRRFRL